MALRPGSAAPQAPELPELVTSTDLPPPALAGQVAARRLLRVRRGAYLRVVPGEAERDAALRRDLARIDAVDRRLGGEHVISHASAALLWGLPHTRQDVVHVTQSAAPHHASADVRRHRCPLPEDDVVLLDGRRVTSLARTAVDCALGMSASDAMAVADAALRAGAQQDDLLARLADLAGRRGVRRARAVLELADAGAESAGESRLRHLVLRSGLPVPQTQLRVPTPGGVFWADLGWEELRLLAEYDGSAKYSADSGAAAAVLAERRREVLMEREGWRVVRVVAADLRRPAGLVSSLQRSAVAGTLPRLEPRPWLA